jgi:hypothetical protein
MKAAIGQVRFISGRVGSQVVRASMPTAPSDAATKPPKKPDQVLLGENLGHS